MYDIKAERIHFNSQREATLTVGEPQVELGSNVQMNGKISELRDIPSIRIQRLTEHYTSIRMMKPIQTPSYRFEIG